MNWSLLAVVPPILLGIVILLMLYAAVKTWKVNQKFLAFIFFALAVACGIAFYALYGSKIFG